MIPGVDGFMYPNEVELQWSILIVLYPFITGLVAGAFILASLERVFNVQAVRPTYRLAPLPAPALLLGAAGAGDRHVLRRHGGHVSVLRVPRRLRARNATPDSPHLRGGRVVPRPRLHG